MTDEEIVINPSGSKTRPHLTGGGEWRTTAQGNRFHATKATFIRPSVPNYNGELLYRTAKGAFIWVHRTEENGRVYTEVDEKWANGWIARAAPDHEIMKGATEV